MVEGEPPQQRQRLEEGEEMEIVEIGREETEERGRGRGGRRGGRRGG